MKEQFKTSKLLFQELGYEENHHNRFIRYCLKKDMNSWYHILFDLKEKINYSLYYRQ